MPLKVCATKYQFVCSEFIYRGKYWIFLEQTLHLQRKDPTPHTKAYELTNLIVDIFSNYLYSLETSNQENTSF